MTEPTTTIERFNDMLTVKQFVTKHIAELNALTSPNDREAWLIQKVQSENDGWKPEYTEGICRYVLNNPLNLSSLNTPDR